AGSGCAWTASSGASWVTITSGASGSGNGTVGYSVAANTGAARSATLTIATKTFTVNQAGTTSGNTITCGQTVNGALATTDGRSPSRGATYYADLYTFTTTGASAMTITLNSTAFDAYLYLRNSAGTVLASNDDGNGGTNSKITYTPTVSGTYTIDATSYSAN